MLSMDWTVRSLDSAGPRPEAETKSRSNSPSASARASAVERSGIVPRRGAARPGASARKASQPLGLDLERVLDDGALGRIGMIGTRGASLAGELALLGGFCERAKAHPRLKLMAP